MGSPHFSSHKSEVNFAKQDVLNKLNELNPTKFAGQDETHPKIKRELSKELCLTSYLCFKASLYRCVVTAEIAVLQKQGTKSEPKNNWLISLTSVSVKILEKNVRYIIYTYLVTNYLL